MKFSRNKLFSSKSNKNAFRFQNNFKLSSRRVLRKEKVDGQLLERLSPRVSLGDPSVIYRKNSWLIFLVWLRILLGLLFHFLFSFFYHCWFLDLILDSFGFLVGDLDHFSVFTGLFFLFCFLFSLCFLFSTFFQSFVALVPFTVFLERLVHHTSGLVRFGEEIGFSAHEAVESIEKALYSCWLLDDWHEESIEFLVFHFIDV